MLNFREYLTENFEIPKDLPEDVFGDLEVEKKSENSKTIVLIARSNDRLTDRDEIARDANLSGLNAKIKPKPGQGVDPVFIEKESNPDIEKRIIILVKPKSGGTGEATLNASITELFPAIAWETGYKMTDSIRDFYTHLLKQDPSKLRAVNKKDLKAAISTIQRASVSSKFEEKMTDAMGVYKFIKDEEKEKKIKTVHWGYRAKPKGVKKNHPGDIFLEFVDGSILGVSLKSGGKKTSEPKLNTYVNPIMDRFNSKRVKEKLRSDLYDKVYSKIKGMPDKKSYDSSNKRKTKEVLVDFQKKYPKRYDKMYDQQLQIVRKTLIDLFEVDKDDTLDYIRESVLRDAPLVPTKVIKTVKGQYEQITEDDELGVFLPLVRVTKTYPSKTSKQDWFIDLESKDSAISMKMSVRTNKSGGFGERKLGQFFNLSVKYNSLKVIK